MRQAFYLTQNPYSYRVSRTSHKSHSCIAGSRYERLQGSRTRSLAAHTRAKSTCGKETDPCRKGATMFRLLITAMLVLFGLLGMGAEEGSCEIPEDNTPTPYRTVSEATATRTPLKDYRRRRRSGPAPGWVYQPARWKTYSRTRMEHLIPLAQTRDRRCSSMEVAGPSL